MATIEAVTPRVYAGTPRRGPITRLLEDERWLASFLLMPTIVLLGLFIAYPFIKGVLLAVTDTRVGIPGSFVGLANFEKLWHDDIFRVAVYNTFLYTFVTTVFKLVLGLWLALLLNRHFRGKAFVRAFILLPFIIPTVLSTFAWKWMFDPTFSVINWMLFHLGMITGRINWLGDPDLAIISVMVVNVWRGVPFYAISLLAGLQTISPELHEAAAIDGARAWNRFRCVTWLLLFIVFLLFPFYWMIVTTVRPDNELYRPWNAANYTPFWTLRPTLEHIRDLLTETLFSTWMMNTMLIATVSTVISLICGSFAGYA